MRISPQDATRVAAAVAAAEATTDAELMVIVAPRSDRYGDVAIGWAALAMLLVTGIVAATPGHGAALVDPLFGGWEGRAPVTMLLTALLLAQAAAFLIARLILGVDRIRLACTPRPIKARRVRARAIEHFRAGIEARTATRTGALLFLSLDEHQAEIVVDKAIAARVPGDAWGETMAALVARLRDGAPGDGIVEAVGRIGALLAEHLPHTGTDPNELADGLVLL